MNLALAWLFLPCMVSVLGFLRLESGHWNLIRIGLLLCFVAFNVAALALPFVLIARIRRALLCLSPVVFLGGLSIEYYCVTGEYPGQAVIGALTVQSVDQIAGLIGFFSWGLIFPLVWLSGYLFVVIRYVSPTRMTANPALRRRRGAWLLLGVAGMSNVYAGSWTLFGFVDESSPYAAKWLLAPDGKTHSCLPTSSTPSFRRKRSSWPST